MSVWNASEWSYRTSSTRNVLIKGKNAKQRKILAEDVSTRLPFVLDLSENVPIRTMKVGKEYLMTFKIYTAKSTEDVKAEFIELFQILDVDRPAEDFLSLACHYPNLIRFEFVDIET